MVLLLNMWDLASFLAMLYAFVFLVYSLRRMRFYSRELFAILLPLPLFAAVHAMYHLTDLQGLGDLAKGIELSSVVILLFLSVQFLREKM